MTHAGIGVSGLALIAASFGCSGEDRNDEQANDEPDAELVTWMGELCDVVTLSVQGLPSPLTTPDATTEADRPPLIIYIAEAQAALSTAQGAAVGLPTPPTAAAGDVHEALRDDLDALASQFAEYWTAVNGLPAGGLGNLYIVSGAAVVSFSPGGEDMSEYLDGHADLAEAYGDAPSCSGESTTTTASGSSTTAGTPEEREAALLEDIGDTFVDEPGGDQQVLETVYEICASLDATDPDRFYPPENTDPAQAASLAESLAGQSPVEVLNSLGRVLGNPVTVMLMARLGAEHVCPEHTDAIEQFAESL